MSSVANVDGVVGDGAGYAGPDVVDEVFRWNGWTVESIADAKFCCLCYYSWILQNRIVSIEYTLI